MFTSNKHFNVYELFFALLFLSVLSGCSMLSGHDSNLKPKPFAALEHDSGWYTAQLKSSEPEYNFDWQILLTRSYISSGNTEQAKNTIAQMRGIAITPLQGNEIDILDALLKNKTGNYGVAEKILLSVNTSSLPNEVSSYYYNLLGKTLVSQNKYADAGLSFLHLSESINSSQKNEAYIKAMNSFNKATNKDLLDAFKKEPNRLYRGFIEYSMIQKVDQTKRKDRLLKQFEKKYPNHEVLALQNAQTSEDSSQPTDNTVKESSEKIIAVFLPLTGKYADIIGNSVKTGILNAYKDRGMNIIIKFYDTSTFKIQELYEQAIKDKAEIIIGPIIKEEVNALINLNPSIPVIALNDSNQAHTNVFYLTLSPEVEAVNIASEMVRNNVNNPMIIAPKNDKGERISISFNNEWFKLTHKNANVCYFTDVNSLPNLLKQCYSNSDANIDAAYIYGTANEASIIREFSKDATETLPIYYIGAKSNNGLINGSAINALNGMYLYDQPWMLKSSSTKDELLEILPKASGDNLRCFAIGYDSLNVALHLNNLLSNPNSSLEGLSGTITIENGKLERNLDSKIIGSN